MASVGLQQLFDFFPKKNSTEEKNSLPYFVSVVAAADAVVVIAADFVVRLQSFDRSAARAPRHQNRRS